MMCVLHVGVSYIPWTSLWTHRGAGPENTELDGKGKNAGTFLTDTLFDDYVPATA